MPRVITVNNCDGEQIGQCSARCYDADPETHCRCICGGTNHGFGRLHAMSTANELASQFWNASSHPEANQLVIPGCDNKRAKNDKSKATR